MSLDKDTSGKARFHFSSEADVARFVGTLEKFERGEIDSEEWRIFRLLNGNYGQRQGAGPNMLRAKIPQGVVSAEQLEAFADAADKYARGFVHFTTRQNIQLHFVPEEKVASAIEDFMKAGLSTREACGNAVRNVTASETSGIASDEVFDPVPYAEAFTRYFLRHPLNGTLPRKFKVAFSGGGADHAFAIVNDIGFFARTNDAGKRGFRIAVAGGTATYCSSGNELFAFLPAGDILALSEAILRVYKLRGDHKNRKKNRMKYLVKQMGFAAFSTEVLAEFETLRADAAFALPFDPEAPPVREALPHTPVPVTAESLRTLIANDVLRGPGILPKSLPMVGDTTKQNFFAANVREQKQPGYFRVEVRLPLGDATSGQVRALARLSRAYSDGTMRSTHTQNVAFHWVPKAHLDALYDGLALIGVAKSHPGSFADPSSCPGAESCKLAVTQSRGLAEAISAHVEADTRLLEATAGLDVKMSGCPNGCGLHHVAAVGFQGGLRKIGGKAAPHYFLYVGGDGRGDKAKFGRFVTKFPAKRVPAVLSRLVERYDAEKNPSETLRDYLARVDVKALAKSFADLAHLDESNAQPSDFIDYAETEPFAAVDEDEPAAQ